MKKLLFAGLLIVFLVPALAMAQSAFEGTWKVDMSKMQFPSKPDVFLLQNGRFQCTSCVPAIDIKADGTDQKVSDDPYTDTQSVKLVDDHHVEITGKKSGKVILILKREVSADGNTLTTHMTYNGNPTGGPQSATLTGTRVAKGPAGAHLISGSWRNQKEDASAAALTWTYKLIGNEITMTTPTGISYTAKTDGTQAPFKGDPSVTHVAVKMMGRDTLVETDYRNGKVVGATKMTIAADGKSANLVSEDKLAGTTYKYVAIKQ